MNPDISSKKRLGQLLCEKAYLDESSLDVALAEQKVEHRPLGRILVDLGYITHAQLNEALAIQVGIGKVDLTDLTISGDLIGLVPAELVNKYNVLPLWQEDGRLAVAMTDPFQPQVLEDLRLVTGFAIRRYYATPIDLEHAVMKFYGSNVARMLDNLVPDDQQLSDQELTNGDFSPAKLQIGSRTISGKSG